MSDRAVVDSTCLIALEGINRLGLLKELFAEVLAPKSVAEEFGQAPEWLHVREVENRTLLDALRTQLGAGESEAIALSTELTDVVTVLDDKKARRIAHEMKLEVKGTIGLLLNAKQQGHLSDLKPILASLDNAGFRMSRELRDEALRLADESD